MSTRCNWAKTIRATNGQHVLAYISHDTEHDDCSSIRFVTRFPTFDADMAISGIPNDKVQDGFNVLTVASADAIIKALQRHESKQEG